MQLLGPPKSAVLDVLRTHLVRVLERKTLCRCAARICCHRLSRDLTRLITVGCPCSKGKGSRTTHVRFRSSPAKLHCLALTAPVNCPASHVAEECPALGQRRALFFQSAALILVDLGAGPGTGGSRFRVCPRVHHHDGGGRMLEGNGVTLQGVGAGILFFADVWNH